MLQSTLCRLSSIVYENPKRFYVPSSCAARATGSATQAASRCVQSYPSTPSLPKPGHKEVALQRAQHMPPWHDHITIMKSNNSQARAASARYCYFMRWCADMPRVSSAQRPGAHGVQRCCASMLSCRLAAGAAASLLQCHVSL
jgi:hypothetical protein